MAHGDPQRPSVTEFSLDHLQLGRRPTPQLEITANRLPVALRNDNDVSRRLADGSVRVVGTKRLD